jgi:hypothetical protein
MTVRTTTIRAYLEDEGVRKEDSFEANRSHKEHCYSLFLHKTKIYQDNGRFFITIDEDTCHIPLLFRSLVEQFSVRLTLDKSEKLTLGIYKDPENFGNAQAEARLNDISGHHSSHFEIMAIGTDLTKIVDLVKTVLAGNIMPEGADQKSLTELTEELESLQRIYKEAVADKRADENTLSRARDELNKQDEDLRKAQVERNELIDDLREKDKLLDEAHEARCWFCKLVNWLVSNRKQ